jgi:hypothetical protein
VTGRFFRIKVHMRRFTRRFPWLAFTIRSFVMFSAAFGGAYGFISAATSKDSCSHWPALRLLL